MQLKTAKYLEKCLHNREAEGEALWLDAFLTADWPAITGNETEGLLMAGQTQSEFWKALKALHLALIDGCRSLEDEAHEVTVCGLAQTHLNAGDVFRALPTDIKHSPRSDYVYFLKSDGGPIDIVGDQHSDPDSLYQIIKNSGIIGSIIHNRPHRMIMLGDYVDRGRAHLEMTAKLLTLKLILKDRLILLRGNHDGGKLLADGQIKLPYGKPESEPDRDYFPLYLKGLEQAQPEAKGLLKAYLSYWDCLAYGAFFQTTDALHLAVHGGVARPMGELAPYAYLESLEKLFSPESLDPYGRTYAQNIMWSDPYRGSGDLREGMGRFYFTEVQARQFLQTVGAKTLLRGHEAFEAGVVAHFEGLVTTVFSSGSNESLTTAYEHVTPKFLRVHANGRREAIEVWGDL